MEKINPVADFVKSDKGKDILTIIIIILVGLGSFILGRMSKNDLNTGIEIDYGSQGASVVNTVAGEINNKRKDINNFFASNRGSKYYTLGCLGGKNIKQENRIYFETSTEAEKAGYQLSSSCE